MSRNVRPSITPHEAAAIWIAGLEAEGYVVPETLDGYRYSLERFFRDTAGLPDKVKNLSAAHAIAFTQAQRTRGIRDQSVRTYQGPVWTWFAWLHQKGYVEVNIAQEVRRQKVRQTPQRRVADDDSVRAIVFTASAAPENPLRNVALVYTLECAGTRRKELLSCHLADLDMANGTLHVPHVKVGRDRVVALSREAKLALLRYVLEERPREKGQPVEGALFLQRGNQPMTVNALKLMLRTQAKNAGVTKGRGSHDYRRKMATDMMEAGVPLDVIAMQGGWQNPNTLPLVYGAEGRQARGLSVIREFNAARKRAR